MTSRTPHHLWPVAIAALVVGASLPCLLGSDLIKRHPEPPEGQELYAVSPPEVPAMAIFAGDTIRLDRYDLRERMDRELSAFTYMHASTMLTIKRANRYFPVIEPILKAHGLPDDLKYLAIIESNLNPSAKSNAGAVGMWQFLAQTGKQYGLEVNANIDERYHVERETVAACKYLLEAYEKYGNWLTAAASYNAGQGRISSGLRSQGVDSAVDLWLVEETARYMFRLLAAKAVFSNPSAYGFRLKSHQLYPPLEYEEVTVTRTIDSLTVFARQHGITYAQLKDANPWLRQSSLANNSRRTYIVKIPTRASMYYDPHETRAHDPRWVDE